MNARGLFANQLVRVREAAGMSLAQLARAARTDWEKLCRAGRQCWLFQCHDTPSALRGTRALAYIRRGERAGVPERYLCSHRSPWYAVERVDPPDIIVTYMSRGGSRFVRSDVGCRILSVFLNVYALPGVDADALRDELASDTTRALLARLGRTYGGGQEKIEPSELLGLPLPVLRVAAVG